MNSALTTTQIAMILQQGQENAQKFKTNILNLKPGHGNIIFKRNKAKNSDMRSYSITETRVGAS